MILNYHDKESENKILDKKEYKKLVSLKGKGAANKLILGDNLEVLKSLLHGLNLAGKIDLIYIDPPFATNNVFKIGEERANTISSSHHDEVAYEDLLRGPEFIEFLRKRIVYLRELMSDKASIYLHIDYKIGHYVKIIMDEIFGTRNFRNDLTRIKCSPKNFNRKAYGNIKDMVLFYTKTSRYTWHEPRMPLTAEDVERLFKKSDEEGKKYTTVPLHAPGETRDGATGKEWRGIKPPKGRHWRSEPQMLDDLDKQGLIEWSDNGVPRKKIFAEYALENGKRMQDIWEFKDPMYPVYPTEKNMELLELILKTSSDVNDLVLDCFLGSGTTIMAAQKLGRKWIGIDQSENAIKVVEKRLGSLEGDLYSPAPCYELLTLSSNGKKM